MTDTTDLPYVSTRIGPDGTVYTYHTSTPGPFAEFVRVDQLVVHDVVLDGTVPVRVSALGLEDDAGVDAWWIETCRSDGRHSTSGPWSPSALIPVCRSIPALPRQCFDAVYEDAGLNGAIA